LIASRRKGKAGEIDISEWETIGGKILSARIEERESPQSDKTGTRKDVTFEPIVDYVYVVNDVEHHDNKVFPGVSENWAWTLPMRFSKNTPSTPTRRFVITQTIRLNPPSCPTPNIPISFLWPDTCLQDLGSWYVASPPRWLLSYLAEYDKQNDCLIDCHKELPHC